MSAPEEQRAVWREATRRYAETHRKEIAERHRRYREAHPEKLRAYREATRAKRAEEKKRWARANPAKRKAQQALNNAINRGKLARPTNCESCRRATKVHGHHEDYSRPLDVQWLCVRCHANVHSKWKAA